MTVDAGAGHGTVDVSETELVHWGRRYAAGLVAPTVVALSGELGAGKTTLARAICAELGVQEQVTSPTFSLVHSYRGAKSQVFHLDLFRVTAPTELINIGWDELMDAPAIVLVEWPDRAGTRLPSDASRVSLAHIRGVPDKRRIAW